jgi:hypothetical protein
MGLRLGKHKKRKVHLRNMTTKQSQIRGVAKIGDRKTACRRKKWENECKVGRRQITKPESDVRQRKLQLPTDSINVNVCGQISYYPTYI